MSDVAERKEELKEMLAKLTEEHHMLFKRMYSKDNLLLDINLVVDRMPSRRLAFARCQVSRTIYEEESKNVNK